MNCTRRRLNSTCKSFNHEHWHQALGSPHIHCQARQVTIMKRLDQGHLHPKLEVPGLTCTGQESNPGPLQWEGSTLEKSHSNILLIAIRNIYIWAYENVVINSTGMAMSGYIKEHLGYMGNFSLGIGSALLAMFYAAIFLKVSSLIATFKTAIFLKVSSIVATCTMQQSSSRLVA